MLTTVCTIAGMATITKSLTLETSALDAGQAAADAAGMTLSAYTSRALRQQAMSDNLRRAAELDALMSDDDRADRDAFAAYTKGRLAGLAGTGDYL